MTTSPVPPDPDATVDDLSTADPAPATTHAHTGTPDPITGEPNAHPIGVGVGALSGGAAGAALGIFAGPVGVVVGAAIGAIAGGLAGKEVAETPEVSPTAEEGGSLDQFDHTPSENAAIAAGEIPLSKPLAEHLTPHEDAFFTGGSLSGKDPDAPTDALDEFDRPHSPVGSATATEHADQIDRPFRPAPAAAKYDLSQDDDNPLPTASSGLVTPDETSIFADSTTGESSMLAESPFPASRAVSPGDSFGITPTTLAADAEETIDTEQAIRTNAYYRYVHRDSSGQPGSAFEDWIAAEKEVLGVF